jgi:hypothetical protein
LSKACVKSFERAARAVSAGRRRPTSFSTNRLPHRNSRFSERRGAVVPSGAVVAAATGGEGCSSWNHRENQYRGIRIRMFLGLPDPDPLV